MVICRVCGRQVEASLRKHATGKFHNDPSDFEHLKLGLELTPGVMDYLRSLFSDNKTKYQPATMSDIDRIFGFKK